jgi:hypothetical protein
MPRTYKPDRPFSPVQQALSTFPFTKWAEIFDLSAATIATWANLDRIPSEHVTKVASLTHREPLEILAYQQDKAKPWPITAPKSKDLDTLLDTPHDKASKQIHTLWGARIQLLYKTLASLNKEFPDQKSLTEAKVHAAAALNIQVRQLNRLLVTYNVNPTCPEGQTTTAKRQADLNRKTRLHYAARAILGTLDATTAAENANVSARTIYRYVDRTLTAQYGLTLSKLKYLPPSFRAALAHDAENDTQNSIMSLIIGKWQALKLQPAPVRRYTHGNWKRVPIPECLIAVLRYEVDVTKVAEDKETDPSNLEWLFTAYLKPLAISFEALKHATLHHHAALADMLEALEIYRNSPKTSQK